MSLTLTHVISSLDWGDHSFHLSQLVADSSRAGITSKIVALKPVVFRHRALVDAEVPVSIKVVRGAFDLPGLFSLVRALRPAHLVQSWGDASRTVGWLRRLGLLTPYWISSQLPGDRLPEALVDPLVVDFRLQADCGADGECDSSHGADGRRAVHGAYARAELDGQHRGNLRSALGLPASCRLVGTAGALGPEDQLKDVIWAADLLKVIRDDVHVIIFGDGPERWRWERFRDGVEIIDHVHFAPPSADVSHQLEELDCYWDVGRGPRLGWGAVCAVCHGVPVICSGCGERERLFAGSSNAEDGGLGAAETCVIRVGDRAQLARATMRILDDPVFASEWAETIQQRFTAGTNRGMTPLQALQVIVDQHAGKK